jgi:hypothetical protein
MVMVTGFLGSMQNGPVESEKCILSALCALFDNRSAAGTPSLAALHLTTRIADAPAFLARPKRTFMGDPGLESGG